MKNPIVFVTLAIAFGACVLVAPAARAGAGASFSATQAARGEKAYERSCAACHGVKLQGVSAPALTGKTSGVAQQSVAEVYVYASQQMPMTAPASLSPATYADIMAYILQANGHKAGSGTLTPAALKQDMAPLGPH